MSLLPFVGVALISAWFGLIVLSWGGSLWGEGILSTLSVISRCRLVPFSRLSSNGEFALFFPARIGVAYNDDAPAVSADDRLPNGFETGIF